MKRFGAFLLALLVLVWPAPASAQALTWTTTQGTVASKWCVGSTSGPCWSNNAGAIEARNAALSAFAVVRGATPSGSNDLTTKAYADGHVTGSVLTAPPGSGTTTILDTSGTLSWGTYPIAGLTAGTNGQHMITVGGVPTWTTITGDVIFSATGSDTLQTITGSGGTVSVPATTFTATQSNSGVTWNQAQQANGSNPVGMVWLAQAPGAGAATTSTGTPGSFLFKLAAPVSTGNEASLLVLRGGTPTAGLGPAPGNPTFGALFLGNSATPAIQDDGSSNMGIGGNTSDIYFIPNGVQFGHLVGTGGSRGWQLGFPGTPTFGGGDNVIGLSDVITAPTSIAGSGGLALYSNAHALESNASNWQFAQIVTAPTLTQPQQLSSANPATMTIAPQAPGASAATTAHGTPGGLTVSLAAPVSTGTEAYFRVSRASGASNSIGSYPGIPSYGVLWLAAASPTGSNWTIASDGASFTDLNAPAGGNAIFAFNGAAVHTMTAGGLQIGSSGTTFGGGVNVIGLTNATVPTATCSGGLCLSSNSGAFEADATAIQFPKFIANPRIQQNAQTTDAATQTLLVQAQNAFASAVTNVVGASLQLVAGSGTTAANGGFTSMNAGDGSTFVEAAPADVFATSGSATSDIAPNGSGTVNSQNKRSHKYRLYCETTTATLVGCGGFFTTIPTGKQGVYRVHWQSRDVTTVNGNTDAMGELIFSYQNSAGSLIVVGGGAGVPLAFGQVLGGASAPSGVNFTTTASGAQVRINVGGYVGTDTVDWTLDVDEIWN